ncbi:hypothetical protein [Streptomyces sp. NPDC048157]|uniref:5'-methylthioadenosine/S-adenosylhomocysteine nucleosidase family protein n=1 Tax=Streptomyces sp. NPDC048157 TaxID=3365503 RepID=UPI00371E22F0
MKEYDSTHPVVMVTALGVEYDAIRAHLRNIQHFLHGGISFEIGDVPGETHPVVLAEVGPTWRSAVAVADQARTLFAPRAVFFVGVAGGLSRSVALGDVVIATHIHNDGSVRDPENDPVTLPVPPTLLLAARTALADGRWLGNTAPTPQKSTELGTPHVHFKPIVAGDLFLTSLDSPLHARLTTELSGAAASVPQGTGSLEAGTFQLIDSLIIRGISDHALTSPPTTSKAIWSHRAAAHAALAAIAIVVAMPHAMPLAGAVEPDPPITREPASHAVQVNKALHGGTVNALQHGHLTIHSNSTPPASPWTSSHDE